MPPLRSRPNDLRALLASEIARASHAQGKAIVGLDPAAADLLLGYHWPGNLRELAKVADTAVALTTGDVIVRAVLLMHLDGEAAPSPRRSRSLGSGSMRLSDAVHEHIQYVLGQVGGSKRRAARELGVARATLERRLKDRR